MTQPAFVSPEHNIFLYCGDMLQILPALVEKGLRCKVAAFDPPYKLTAGGPSGVMSGAFDPANYSNNGSIVECDLDWPDFMPLVFDALEDRAHCYTFANDKNVRAMLNAGHDAGFRFHNLLNWQKGTMTPNRWYMKDTEYIGFFFKGEAYMISNPSSKQSAQVPQIDESGHMGKPAHPTEKPVPLMRHYIDNSSKPGDLVLDPFMGSGTTGVAALKSGRGFVGIEKDQKYFDMAVRRIKEAMAEKPQLCMFA